MDSQKRVDVKWKFDNKNAKESNRNHQLHEDFVKMLRRRLQTSAGTTVTGCTKAVISCSGKHTSFYAHPCFHGHKWYDWALVHFEEQDNQGEYWVMCLLMVNKKLPYSVRQNQFFGAQSKESLFFRLSWEQILTFLLFQFQ